MRARRQRIVTSYGDFKAKLYLGEVLYVYGMQSGKKLNDHNHNKYHTF